MKRLGRMALVAACLWILGPGGGLAVPGAGGPALVEQGRRAYGAGDFAAAASAFTQAVTAAPGLATASLCLDAATASRLAGQPGRAVWWLYQGALAAPADAALGKALAAAGADRQTLFAGMWRPVGWLDGRTQWVIVLWANAAFWLVLAGARLLSRPLPRGTVRAAGALVAALWLAVLWTAFVPTLCPRGVVLSGGPARSAPEPEAEAVGELPAGSLVRLGPKRGGDVRVETADGLAGWVARDTVATFLP